MTSNEIMEAAYKSDNDNLTGPGKTEKLEMITSSVYSPLYIEAHSWQGVAQ